MALTRYFFSGLFMMGLFACSNIAAFADSPPKMEWSKPLALPVTKEVKAACEATDDVNQAYCYGVLLGLYDSSFYLADAMQAQQLCLPGTTTPTQMRDAFLDVTKKRADQLEGPISIFYYMAMEAEFPCKAQTPSSSKSKK